MSSSSSNSNFSDGTFQRANTTSSLPLFKNPKEDVNAVTKILEHDTSFKYKDDQSDMLILTPDIFSSVPSDSLTASPSRCLAKDVTKSQEEKPDLSYAALIKEALGRNLSKLMTLSEIYEWIMENYPYYRTAQPGWKNSIRHNLSLHKIFARVARPDNHPGKGSFWKLSTGDPSEIPKKPRQPRKSSSMGSACDFSSSSENTQNPQLYQQSSYGQQPFAIQGQNQQQPVYYNNQPVYYMSSHNPHNNNKYGPNGGDASRGISSMAQANSYGNSSPSFLTSGTSISMAFDQISLYPQSPIYNNNLYGVSPVTRVPVHYSQVGIPIPGAKNSKISNLSSPAPSSSLSSPSSTSWDGRYLQGQVPMEYQSYTGGGVSSSSSHSHLSSSAPGTFPSFCSTIPNVCSPISTSSPSSHLSPNDVILSSPSSQYLYYYPSVASVPASTSRPAESGRMGPLGQPDKEPFYTAWSPLAKISDQAANIQASSSENMLNLEYKVGTANSKGQHPSGPINIDQKDNFHTMTNDADFQWQKSNKLDSTPFGSLDRMALDRCQDVKHHSYYNSSF